MNIHAIGVTNKTWFDRKPKWQPTHICSSQLRYNFLTFMTTSNLKMTLETSFDSLKFLLIRFNFNQTFATSFFRSFIRLRWDLENPKNRKNTIYAWIRNLGYRVLNIDWFWAKYKWTVCFKESKSSNYIHNIKLKFIIHTIDESWNPFQ